MTYKPSRILKTKASGTDVAVKAFAKEVDMELLHAFLAEDAELDTFARALQDPAYSHSSFMTLLRRFNVPLSRVQEIYTTGMRNLGLIRMSSSLPEVMAHVAEDAKSKDIVCPRCDGRLTIKTLDGNSSPCPVCKEKGTIRVPGDKHARDLMFESMKLTGQSGPLVSINQNFRTPEDENMASMFKMTQQISVGAKDERELDSPEVDRP